jgi:DNA polymerase III subunit delta'
MSLLIRELVGQKHAVELLRQAIKKQRIAPAYLFSGPDGIGKSLTASAFSQSLLGLKSSTSLINHPDFLRVEPSYLVNGKLLTPKEAEEAGAKRKAPPTIKIEQVREITEFLSRPPLQSERSVVIIEDAHTMAEGAANALLKTLEEPGRATLILIAPNPDSLLSTLVSRCQFIPFYRLSQVELAEVLNLKGYEGLDNNPFLMAIAQGSPGSAIVAHRQLQNIGKELLQKLQQPINHPLEVFALAKLITTELDNETQLWLIDYLQYFYWEKHRNYSIIKELEQGKKLLRRYVQPRLVWECCLMKLC